MLDLLKRYFVGNTAPIFAVDRHPAFSGAFVPCRGGNFGGFFWRGWRVTWRRPYAKCWRYDADAKRWVSGS